MQDKEGKSYEVCGRHVKELYKLQLNARLEHLLTPEWQKVVDERAVKLPNDDWER